MGRAECKRISAVGHLCQIERRAVKEELALPHLVQQIQQLRGCGCTHEREGEFSLQASCRHRSKSGSIGRQMAYLGHTLATLKKALTTQVVAVADFSKSREAPPKLDSCTKHLTTVRQEPIGTSQSLLRRICEQTLGIWIASRPLVSPSAG